MGQSVIEPACTELVERVEARARNPSRFARSQSALPAGHPVGVSGDAQTAMRTPTRQSERYVAQISNLRGQAVAFTNLLSIKINP